jgi:4-amino-4-deoxy-L-arabinose transferase-like glycosyltransferase
MNLFQIFQRHQQWIIIIVAILCLLPFVNKAVHIDDPLFIWAAKHISVEPLNPYNFNVNWYGTQEPMYNVTKNPPLASYYMALVGSIFGWSEVVLHIAFFIPAVLLILGTYHLAKHLSVSPLSAALATLFTPVVLVSSTTLMCDILMLCFWVWGMVLWISGVRKNNRRYLLFAAFLIAFSALTKYFGMALIPLILLWTIAERQRFDESFIYLLIPVAILAWYQWATTQLYGRGLLLDAAKYVSMFEQPHTSSFYITLLTGIAFTGGCVGSAVFFFPRIWNRTLLILNAILLPALILIMMNLPSIGNVILVHNGTIWWGYIIQFVVFTLIGSNILIMTVWAAIRKRDSDSLLLGVWIIGTFVFAAFMNWTINARTLLPLAPPLAILIIREYSGRKTAIPLTLAMVFSLIVTYADFDLANTIRDNTETIVSRYSDRAPSIHFEGHWGFQYYMESRGCKPLDTEHPVVAPNDIIAYAFNNTNYFRLPEPQTQLIDSLTSGSVPWIATMNNRAGAGFYSDVFGPLPFVFGTIPPERYNIHIVHVGTR